MPPLPYLNLPHFLDNMLLPAALGYIMCGIGLGLSLLIFGECCQHAAPF
jgi:hypothetical protein